MSRQPWNEDLWQHTISDLVLTPVSETGQPWGHSHIVCIVALSPCSHMCRLLEHFSEAWLLPMA